MIDNLTSGIISIIMIYLCSRFNFNFKNHKKFKFLIYSLSIIIIRSIYPIKENLHINLIFGIIICISVPALFFEGDLWRKLFFSLSYCVLSMLCEIMTMSLFSLFFSEQIISNYFAYYLGMIITNVILIAIMYLYSLYWKIFSLSNIPKISFLLISLPITTIVLVINVKDFIVAINNTFLYGLTMLGLLFSNVACVYIYYKTVISITKENELKKELEKTNIEYEAANNLLTQHNVFLHDIRSKTIEMLHLLRNKKFSKLEDYIQNTYYDTMNIYNMINSNYKIVDVLINDRIYILKNNNIRLRVNLECIDFGSCNMIEMEKIFSFMIDLAISECIQSSSNYIYINSKAIKNKTILSFTFSSKDNNKILINDEITEIFNSHKIFYLIDRESKTEEMCISILFFSEE